MRYYLIGVHLILALLMSASFIMNLRETLSYRVIKSFRDFVSKDPYAASSLFIAFVLIAILVGLIYESRWVILPAGLSIFLGGVMILLYSLPAMLEGMDSLSTVIDLIGLVFIGHEVGVIAFAIKYFGQR